ncbi:MAG: hypothetical protein VCF24_18925 [Candidatus Latescibacterota bacterium]
MIKIGCKYLSFKGAEISVEDFIQTCHDLRLDSLDFHRRAFASDDTDYLLGIKRQCLDLGLPVGYLGVAGGFAGDDDFQQAKIEEAKSAVDMAMVLGAPLIRVFGWHTYETEGRDPMFAALARCLRLRGQEGRRCRTAEPQQPATSSPRGPTFCASSKMSTTPISLSARRENLWVERGRLRCWVWRGSRIAQAHHSRYVGTIDENQSRPTLVGMCA